MERTACFESYPMSTVALANLQSISICAIGAYILSGLGLALAGLYIIYVAALAVNVMRNSCVNCYYFGKVCFSGWGKISPYLFNKGDSSAFSQRELTWLAILPDFLTTIIPVFGGIVLIAVSFSWVTVGLVVVLVFLSTGGNALVRGRLACRFCKQRELGCPAEKLFQKGKGAES